MLGTEIIEGKCEEQLVVKRQNLALPTSQNRIKRQKKKKLLDQQTFGMMWKNAYVQIHVTFTFGPTKFWIFGF